MMRSTGQRPLPVTLPPATDELLSSWIGRHARFYDVTPLEMLRHCLPDSRSLCAADMNLTDDQIRRLTTVFSSDPHIVRRMTFVNVAPPARRLVAATPAQHCEKCASERGDADIVMRSRLSGWRITCPVCGDPLRDLDDCPAPYPFKHHWNAALRGERLLDDEAERSVSTWASPAEIARLLLMRRRPDSVHQDTRLEDFRVLGVVIPELDDVVAGMRIPLPSPASPILPIHLRPALLAGVAIVERSGPAMIEMLHARLIGENRTRFGRLAGPMIADIQGTPRPIQLHLM